MSKTSLLSAVFGNNERNDDNAGLFNKTINPMEKKIVRNKIVEKIRPTKNVMETNEPTNEDHSTSKDNAETSDSKRVKGGKKRMRAAAAAALQVQEKKKKENEIEITHTDTKESDETKSVENENDDDDGDLNEDTGVRANDKNDRTIFVGNLPLPTSRARKLLHSLFASCGAIETSRVRSVAVQGVKLPQQSAGNQSMMRKVCANTNLVDDSIKQSVNGYVVFQDKVSVGKALLLNNTVVRGENGGKDMHVRVDTATPTVDSNKSVFIGTLPFKASEEEIRSHFIKSIEGIEIENVRVIRDNETQRCKGIAYVLFKTKDMVADALRLDGTTCCNRQIRVQVCGKRYKGNRGHEKASKGSDDYSGRRATEGATKRILSKLKSKNMVPSKSTVLPKKRRARGEKPKVGASVNKTPGMSRRAASEAKVNKRAKKIQKRIRNGMGKNKK